MSSCETVIIITNTYINTLNEIVKYLDDTQGTLPYITVTTVQVFWHSAYTSKSTKVSIVTFEHTCKSNQSHVYSPNSPKPGACAGTLDNALTDNHLPRVTQDPLNLAYWHYVKGLFDGLT